MMTIDLDIRPVIFTSPVAPCIKVDSLIILDRKCKTGETSVKEIEIVDHRIWGHVVVNVVDGKLNIVSANISTDKIRKEAGYGFETFDFDVVYTS